ncbi:MAG: VTT domain-containing protein [Pseudomonadota bacterium]
MVRPKLWLRLALVVVLAGGLAYVAFNRGAVNPLAIQQQLDALGWGVPLAFIGYHVVATLFFVPRFVMGAVAGALFGFWWGALWSMTGAMAGAAAGFLIARYVNGGMLVPEAMPRIGRWLERAETGGWKAVAILRLVPVPHPITNYALGLTRIRFGAYLWGSLLGLVPSTFAYVDIGLGGRNAAFGIGNWVTPVLWGIGLLVLSALLSRLFRRKLG